MKTKLVIGILLLATVAFAQTKIAPAGIIRDKLMTRALNTDKVTTIKVELPPPVRAPFKAYFNPKGDYTIDVLKAVNDVFGEEIMTMDGGEGGGEVPPYQFHDVTSYTVTVEMKPSPTVQYPILEQFNTNWSRKPSIVMWTTTSNGIPVGNSYNNFVGTFTVHLYDSSSFALGIDYPDAASGEESNWTCAKVTLTGTCISGAQFTAVRNITMTNAATSLSANVQVYALCSVPSVSDVTYEINQMTGPFRVVAFPQDLGVHITDTPPDRPRLTPGLPPDSFININMNGAGYSNYRIIGGGSLLPPSFNMPPINVQTGPDGRLDVDVPAPGPQGFYKVDLLY